jgi:hypothetical protein
MSDDKSKHSLLELTRAFVKLLIDANGKEVDLNEAGDSLDATKRRLYDVTNVLAGIGVIVRCGKARVKWVGTQASGDDEADLKDLQAQEENLEQLTTVIDDALASLTASPEFEALAWLSDEDVLRLTGDELTLFALRGPPDLQIEVPEDEGSGQHRLIFTSQSGAIDLIPIHQAKK